jgi:glucose/arabinose dehydrogenase
MRLGTLWQRSRLAVALLLVTVAGLMLARARNRVAELNPLVAADRPSAVALAVVEAAPASAEVRLVEVARGFDRPLFVAEAPGRAGLFVVEQTGRIRIVRDGEVLEPPFLDLSADLDSAGGERGLLGLAFAPDYAVSGRFFVAHTAPGPAVVVRGFRASADPDRADPASARLVLSMADPAGNHNGGMIAFGPDGHLWIGTGDGGSAGDPWNNAQDTGSLLGKILRLEVGREPYGIPADNPFADGRRGRPEVWAFGLRNPWRFSFDRATGELWVADVGQYAWEEISVEDPRLGGGLNYGWKTMEGLHCFSPRKGCDASGLHLPVYEYGHDQGCSVTGGYVYRGQELPDLVGRYVFSDYCSGRLWALRRTKDGGVEVTRLAETGRRVSSFGEDAAGELYLVDHRGEVLRLVGAL